MKAFTSLVVLFVSISIGRSQTTEPLLRRPAGIFAPSQLYLGEKPISYRKMGRLLERENPEAYAEFRRSRSQRPLQIVTGLPGSFLLGYEVGSLVGGARINALRGGLGLGLFVASYTFMQNEEKYLERAIALHNQRAGRLRLELGPTTSGAAGLRMHF
jgi:hypothetical protein